MAKNPHAVALGKKGGSATSERKARAVRKNGKKGGRPKKIAVALVVLIAALTAACSGSPTAPSVDQPAANLESIFQFMEADPWIHPVLGEPVGPWARRVLRGVEVRLDPSMSQDVGARANLQAHTLLWRPANADLSRIRQAATLIHEARHFDGRPHTCGSQELGNDRTMAEGGAFAVQIVYLEHAGDLSIAQWLRDTYIGCR